MTVAKSSAKPTSRGVTQVPRLADQVYHLMKEDLIGKVFSPGQRVVEREMGERYNVSRTPIREAMARLSQDGLLEVNDRGYSVPYDAQRDVIDRLEVRQLLDTQLVRRAARFAQPQEILILQEYLDRETSAHEAGKHKDFTEAHRGFKEALQNISRNHLLNRCAALVDEAFQPARERILETPENQRKALAYDGEVLDAIRRHDEIGAVAAVERFISLLRTFLCEDRHAADTVLWSNLFGQFDKPKEAVKQTKLR